MLIEQINRATARQHQTNVRLVDAIEWINGTVPESPEADASPQVEGTLDTAVYELITATQRGEWLSGVLARVTRGYDTDVVQVARGGISIRPGLMIDRDTSASAR